MDIRQERITHLVRSFNDGKQRKRLEHPNKYAVRPREARLNCSF